MIKQNLLKKIETKEAVVCVIGLGYVGLPLALSFSEKEYKVVGIDNDLNKIQELNKRKSFLLHLPSSKIESAFDKGFKATDNFSLVSESDAIIICVPTPLNKSREPDLSHIMETIDSILPFIKKGQIVTLVSTTYPGTTEEVLLPKFLEAGFKVGKDFFLAFSPEREDPGNQKYDTTSIPKIVGGHTEDCLEVVVSLFSKVISKIIPVSSTKVAETAKLLENIYRAVNIGLVNEMKKITDKLNIDIFEVIEAASSKPFGYKAFYPGPGLGGHCIPIDPFYLSWKARQFGLDHQFIELAGEINTSMPDWVIEKIGAALSFNGQTLKGSKVLLLGMAYKKNIDDTRESPSLVILEKLIEMGTSVDFCDPFVKLDKINTKSLINRKTKKVQLTKKNLLLYDAVVLITDHEDFNYSLIRENSKIIVDTRGVFKPEKGKIYRA